MYTNKIPEIIIKSQSPYHGLSTTSRVQNGILENTIRRFTVFSPDGLDIGHLLIPWQFGRTATNPVIHLAS